MYHSENLWAFLISLVGVKEEKLFEGKTAGNRSVKKKKKKKKSKKNFKNQKNLQKVSL